MGLVLLVGRLLLVAGLYGMAYAVARVMWQGLPGTVPTGTGRRPASLRLGKAVGVVSAGGVVWNEGSNLDLLLPITFGRQVGNTVTIEDPFVSACHAELVTDGTALWLIDRGSKNGIWLGRERLERPAKVGAGTEFRLGGTVFAVLG